MTRLELLCARLQQAPTGDIVHVTKAQLGSLLAAVHAAEALNTFLGKTVGGEDAVLQIKATGHHADVMAAAAAARLGALDRALRDINIEVSTEEIW